MHFNQLTNSVYAPLKIGNCHQSIYKDAPVSPPFARLVQGFSGLGGSISPIVPASYAKNRSGNSSCSSFDNQEVPGDFPGKLRRIKEVSYENSFSKPPEIGQSFQRMPSVREAKAQAAPTPEKPAPTPQKKSLDLQKLRRRFLTKAKPSLPQMDRFARTLTKEPTEE